MSSHGSINTDSALTCEYMDVDDFMEEPAAGNLRETGSNESLLRAAGINEEQELGVQCERDASIGDFDVDEPIFSLSDRELAPRLAATMKPETNLALLFATPIPSTEGDPSVSVTSICNASLTQLVAGEKAVVSLPWSRQEEAVIIPVRGGSAGYVRLNEEVFSWGIEGNPLRYTAQRDTRPKSAYTTANHGDHAARKLQDGARPANVPPLMHRVLLHNATPIVLAGILAVIYYFTSQLLWAALED